MVSLHYKFMNCFLQEKTNRGEGEGRSKLTMKNRQKKIKRNKSVLDQRASGAGGSLLLFAQRRERS